MVVCMKQRVCSGQLDKTEGSRDNFRHCAPTPFYFCSSSVLAFENIALYTLEPEEQKKILGYFSFAFEGSWMPRGLSGAVYHHVCSCLPASSLDAKEDKDLSRQAIVFRRAAELSA